MEKTGQNSKGKIDRIYRINRIIAKNWKGTLMGNLADKEITEKVIGCAFAVHKKLGPGFLEKVYENAMVLELVKAGLQAKQQVPINVYYDNVRIGEYFADLLVEDKILCELKANMTLVPEHEVQLVNYLTATGLNTGLLINFGASVTVKRKFREYAGNSAALLSK